jgi:glycosyltransferase involved in cell wall biosynthesis
LKAAVVPAQNEEGRIGRVLENVFNSGIDSVFVVINGSDDGTLDAVEKADDNRITKIVFEESLGFDVPRVVGAYAAYRAGAELVVFVDGDLIGNIARNVKELIDGVAIEGTDMALTNCYPSPPKNNPLTTLMLHFRSELNHVLGIYKAIGTASPSHGPHAVSRRFLDVIPFIELAIPPVAMALAVKNNLRVAVSTTLPHSKLGSRIKDNAHAFKIAETIIGDCIEGVCVFKGIERSRTHKNQEFLGYNPERRFDLLSDFMQKSP